MSRFYGYVRLGLVGEGLGTLMDADGAPPVELDSAECAAQWLREGFCRSLRIDLGDLDMSEALRAWTDNAENGKVVHVQANHEVLIVVPRQRVRELAAASSQS